MSDVIKICKKHGNLTIDNVYHRKKRDVYECRECMRDSEKRRPKRIYEGEFAEYHRNHAREWRRKNNDYINEKIRTDRLVNPEKYREWENNNRNKNIERYRMLDRIRRRKISEEEYLLLMAQCENLCSICKKEETRVSKTTDEICNLIIDHCHACEEKGAKGLKNVRGILCHSCNMLIRRDINELPESAIQYLEKHKHIKDDSTGAIHE